MIGYNYKTHILVFRTRNYNMAGVTSAGFEPKTFQEILTELNTKATLPENFGEEFPVTPDSAFGVLANIISAALKDQWDLSANTVDQQNRDKAEGKYLNDLAALVGLTRLLAAGSSGFLAFTGQQSATVPAQTPIKAIGDKLVLTERVLTLNRSLCYSSLFSVNIVAAQTYTLTIEGDTFSYAASSVDTEETILDGLISAIGSQVRYTASKPTATTLQIKYSTTNNVLTTTNSDNIILDSVTSLVQAEAVVVGAVLYPVNTLTNFVQGVTGIQSVSNPEDLTLGREEETDTELRQRMSEREQNTGTATIPAIQASVTNIDGVVSSFARENITLSTDAQGLPAKSFEVFVEGGTDNNIANVILNTKPAGIETFGTTTVIVADVNGDEREIKFSRFSNKYAWVRVTYSINSEESFPSNGEDLIKDAVVTTGGAMHRGEDLEPTKFYGGIYSTVSGIYVSKIEVAITDTAVDTPAYVETRISIPDTTELLFDITRVPVTT